LPTLQRPQWWNDIGNQCPQRCQTGSVLLLANAVAFLHAAAVLFMLTGGLIALRRLCVVAVHVPVALSILAVYLTGVDCPLTTLELWLRAAAGEPTYGGGFLAHYLFEPLGLDATATSTQGGMYVVALGLNALAYVLVTAHVLHGRTAGLRGSAARPSRMPAGTAVSSGSQR
jgi:hypothetical protein